MRPCLRRKTIKIKKKLQKDPSSLLTPFSSKPGCYRSVIYGSPIEDSKHSQTQLNAASPTNTAARIMGDKSSLGEAGLKTRVAEG